MFQRADFEILIFLAATREGGNLGSSFAEQALQGGKSGSSFVARDETVSHFGLKSVSTDDVSEPRSGEKEAAERPIRRHKTLFKDREAILSRDWGREAADKPACRVHIFSNSRASPGRTS